MSYEVDDLEKRKILQGQRALPKDETEQDEEEANNKHETCETRRTMGINLQKSVNSSYYSVTDRVPGFRVVLGMYNFF